MDALLSHNAVTHLTCDLVFGCGFSGGYLWFTGALSIPHVSGLAGVAYIGAFEMAIPFITSLQTSRLSRTTA